MKSPRTTTVGQIRLLAVPAFASEGRTRVGTVVVGLQLVPYRHTEVIALGGMILLDVFVLIGGSLVARRAVGVALRPVAVMTAKASEWSDHDLDQRFHLGAPRDELTGLSATLDALLARIGASIRHEQRLSAEVAHELNTPLSGLRAEAELALAPSATPGDQRAALNQVLRSTDRMATVIRTLLSAARQSADHSPGSSDAAEALREAVQAIAREAGARTASSSAFISPNGHRSSSPTPRSSLRPCIPCSRTLSGTQAGRSTSRLSRATTTRSSVSRTTATASIRRSAHGSSSRAPAATAAPASDFPWRVGWRARRPAI